MAQVYNWHLGREMVYPYEGNRPKRQFAAVFNINRCIGCQTCTMACKSTWTFAKGQEDMWWNNVETKPFGGYPQHWDVKILQQLGPQPGWDARPTNDKAPYGTYQGKTIFEAAPTGQAALGYLPEDKEWRFPNIYEDTTNAPVTGPQGDWTSADLPEHRVWFFYLARICNHCTYPACLAACPRKAIYKRPEDGIVLVDQQRCRGYRKCVEACPYKKTLFRRNTRVAEKCIACYPRLEEGMIPRCVAACVGKIRLMGWVDDEKSPVHYLVHKAKVALPLYPQFGLEPNVYYIPPRWVPRGYLQQMFGPGVDAAIQAYAKPSHELLGLLQLFGSTQSIIASYTITANEAIGYDVKGHELVRVPFRDPVYVRSKTRLNVT
jgi:nitrate reductase beta subunit